MTASKREDYLLRQAKEVAAMLARMAGLRSSGELEQARIELEQAYSLLLGSQGELLRQVDSGTAARLLGSRERIAAFAQLLNEEAAQEADEHRRAHLSRRAVQLQLEAERLDSMNPKHSN
jgi:hypothetical protein